MNLIQTDNMRLIKKLEEKGQIGYWHYTPDDGSIFWSDLVYKIHGISKKSFSPNVESAVNFYHPDDRHLVQEALKKSMETKTDFSFEARIVQPSKSIVLVRSCGECELGNNGEVVSIFGTFQDITNEKKRLFDLQQQTNFLDLIMSNVPDPLFVKDKNFRIVRANAAFLEMYPEEIRDNVIGHTTVENYNEDEAREFLKKDIQAFEDGLSITEETLKMPDGKVRTLLTKKVRFIDNADCEYILGIARDITELKEKTKELSFANEELEEFAYRTSHDLRSPVISSLRLLEMSKDAMKEGDFEKVEKIIGLCVNSLNKLEKLAADILSLTKLKNVDGNMVDVSVKDFLEKAISDAQHFENFERLDIKINLDENLIVKTSPSRLEIILNNLISNAVKYQDQDKDKSFLNLSARKKGNIIYLDIEDNGVGIPEDKQDDMYKMFKRFHSNISFGSGLGLYMVRKSADLIGADIKYKNTEYGSKFTLALPLY